MNIDDDDDDVLVSMALADDFDASFIFIYASTSYCMLEYGLQASVE